MSSFSLMRPFAFRGCRLSGGLILPAAEGNVITIGVLCGPTMERRGWLRYPACHAGTTGSSRNSYRRKEQIDVTNGIDRLACPCYFAPNRGGPEYDDGESRDMDVDLGIIYTHERRFMTPLVSSLAQSGRGIAMRLVLIDNASADGVDEWRDTFRETLVVRNEMRLGYAANLNRILEASHARYALLLNTDMYFDPAEQCVAKMVQFMDRHPDCGVSGCRLYHPDGSYGFPARRFQTVGTIAARRLGLGKLLGRKVDS